MNDWQNEQRQKQTPAGLLLFRLFSIMAYGLLFWFLAGDVIYNLLFKGYDKTYFQLPVYGLPWQLALYFLAVGLVVLVLSNIIATQRVGSHPFKETPRSEDIASDAHGRSSISKLFGGIVAAIFVPISLVIILTSPGIGDIGEFISLFLWAFLLISVLCWVVGIPLAILAWISRIH